MEDVFIETPFDPFDSAGKRCDIQTPDGMTRQERALTRINFH
ncbi:hypothetical protein [Rhizobium sp. AG855]|nr:hypothetical protein [Rhizobium sp. AG855]